MRGTVRKGDYGRNWRWGIGSTFDQSTLYAHMKLSSKQTNKKTALTSGRHCAEAPVGEWTRGGGGVVKQNKFTIFKGQVLRF